MYQSITMSAGVALEFTEAADFVRVFTAPEDTQVIFYAAGREVGRAENVGGGYSEKASEPFDKIRIVTASGGLVQFVMRLGNEVTYDKPPSAGGNQGAFTQTQATVTNASGVLLNASNTRRYLMIQNNDATGIVYVTLDGTAATTTKGVKLLPGAALELANYVPTGEIRAIGSIASNANVIVIAG